MLHHRTCNLCEALCGVDIETEGDQVVSIRGDERDPFSKGYICPKATALGDIHHDPDRLRRPLRRTATGFEEIDWDEALSLAAARLGEIRRRHGAKSVAFYMGNPTVHNLGATLGSQVFNAALKSHNRYSATSVDQLPKMLASYLMYGHQLLMAVPDIDRSDLFIIFGANPLVSNGSLMSAPGVKHRLEAVQARGGRVVVFDPRRTETARMADEHHFVRPGTDSLVLLSMLHVVFLEGRLRLGRFAASVTGLDDIRRIVTASEFSPESTATATGVEPEVVRRTARALADTGRAVVYGRVGVSIQEFGGVANWLIEVLNVVTGHFDEEGGMMFTTPAVDTIGLGTVIGLKGDFKRFKSRVRGAPEFGGELPVSCMAEEMETPGEGQIRALVTLAGNPVLSAPNGRRLDRALEGLEFMVSVDPYLNETTRHAQLILPPTFALEHDNYDIALNTYSVRNTARWSDTLFERAPDQRHDWEILTELAARLTAKGDALDPLRETALRFVTQKITPRTIVDGLIRIGPYGLRKSLTDGLTLAKVAASVHGVDLGALRRVMPGRLQTRDKRIQLAPKELVADLPRLRARVGSFEAVDAGTLRLIGRRELRSNNSWSHNVARLMKGRARCTLLMHPRDAEARGLRTGDRATLASRAGSVVAPVEVTSDVMPGVVSLPHGYGHDRKGTRMRVAEANAGVSVNDVTDETLLDELSGVANLCGVPVKVERVAEAVETV